MYIYILHSLDWDKYVDMKKNKLDFKLKIIQIPKILQIMYRVLKKFTNSTLIINLLHVGSKLDKTIIKINKLEIYKRIDTENKALDICL